MGSVTCRNHLQNISKHLIEFERQPKEIEGNLIRKWFNEGENIFEEFYHLGTNAKWNSANIKNYQTEVNDVVLKVSNNQGWLQTFITIYPGLRVDLEGATPAVNVCRIRSGVEFLLKGFKNINTKFDKVLVGLEDLGELEEFDDHLKIWKESHRPDFFPGDRQSDTPKSHWWWF